MLDNYHTHKHDDINQWLAKNPRITLHFTPTSGSWLNLVEVFFSIITRQAIRRGSFDSVKRPHRRDPHLHRRLQRPLPPVHLDQECPESLKNFAGCKLGRCRARSFPLVLSDRRAQLPWRRCFTQADGVAVAGRAGPGSSWPARTRAGWRPLTRVAARTGLSRGSPSASGGSASWSARMDGLGDAPRPGGGAEDHRRAGRGAGHAHLTERGRGHDNHWSPGRWPRRPACRSRPSRGSGGRSGSSRTWRRRSSCARTRSSSARSATSSASTCPRPRTPWSCAWTRSPRSRRWTGTAPCCRCCRAPRAPAPTTTSAHGTTTCSPRSTSPRLGHRLSPPAPRAGVPAVPRQARRRGPERPGRPPGLRQLRHPQDPGRSTSWLLTHPRFHLHFTPTSSSWINLVERWFAELTNRKAPPLSPPQRHRPRNRTSASGSTSGTRTRGRSSGHSHSLMAATSTVAS